MILFQMVSFLYPHPTLLFELETSEVNRGSLKQPILQRKSPNFSQIFIELQEVSRRLFELVGKMKMSSFRWYLGEGMKMILFQMVSFLYPHPTLLFELETSEVNRGSLKQPILQRKSPNFSQIFIELQEVSRRLFELVGKMKMSSFRWYLGEGMKMILFQMVSFLYPHPTLLFELETSEVNRGSLKQPILQRKSPNFSQIFIELQEVSRRLFELVGKMKMSSFRWYHFHTLTQHYFLSQRPQKLTAVA